MCHSVWADRRLSYICSWGWKLAVRLSCSPSTSSEMPSSSRVGAELISWRGGGRGKGCVCMSVILNALLQECGIYANWLCVRVNRISNWSLSTILNWLPISMQIFNTARIIMCKHTLYNYAGYWLQGLHYSFHFLCIVNKLYSPHSGCRWDLAAGPGLGYRPQNSATYKIKLACTVVQSCISLWQHV